MELREFVRVKQRWLVPLAAVPLLAAAVAALVLVRQPETYTAAVTIQVPGASANNDSQIGLYTARLAQAVRLGDVRQQVEEKTGVGRDDILELGVSRVEQSDQVILTLTSTAGTEDTLAAAEAVAKAAVVMLVEPASGSSEGELEAAGRALSEAQLRLLDFQASIGRSDPAAAYQAVSASLQTAQDQLAAAEGAGDTVGADLARGQIEALEAQRSSLIQQLQRINVLQAQVEAAQRQLTDAQQGYAGYEARLAAASTGRQIVDSVVVAEPRIRPVIEGAGLAAVLAFLAVLGISLLPDLLRRQGEAGATSDGLRARLPFRFRLRSKGHRHRAESARSDRVNGAARRPEPSHAAAATAPATAADVGTDAGTEKSGALDDQTLVRGGQAH